MIYLWENPEYYADKFMAVYAVYNEEISMDRFLFRKGIKYTPEQVSGKRIFELK